MAASCQIEYCYIAMITRDWQITRPSQASLQRAPHGVILIAPSYRQCPGGIETSGLPQGGLVPVHWWKKHGILRVHCEGAGGGVAVRRGPLLLSCHLRLPTRVSRCEGIALVSCPAVTIILLCLFRYASTAKSLSVQGRSRDRTVKTYALVAGILADHQRPASDSMPSDSQSHSDFALSSSCFW
jgi:hypothetical protein